MRRILYRTDTKQIVFYDSLDIVTLNESGAFIFESLCDGLSKAEIAKKFSAKFTESLENSVNFVDEYHEQLQSLDIKISKELLSGAQFNPHTPIIHIIQNCNSPCVMCDCWKTKGKSWHSREILHKLFKKLKDEGAQGIMVSGGEPLIHPDLKDILTDLKDLDLEIYLNSNGFLIKRNLEWLKDLAIEELVVSMDAINATDYKTIRGTDKFNLVCKNINEFKAISPSTRMVIRTTLTKYIINDIKELILFAKNNSIDHIGFSPLDVSSSSFSRLETNQEKETIMTDLLFPNEDELHDSIEKIKEKELYDFLQNHCDDAYIAWGPDKIINCLEFYINTLNGNEKNFNNDPCAFPFISMLLDYDGSVKSCFYDEPFGNIHDFDNIDWDFSKRIKKLERTGKCKTCRGKIFCDTGTFV